MTIYFRPLCYKQKPRKQRVKWYYKRKRLGKPRSQRPKEHLRGKVLKMRPQRIPRV